MKRVAFVAALLLGFPIAARAQWVFDNGPAYLIDDGTWSTTLDYSVHPIYSQFYLPRATHITLIQYNAWWIRDVPDNPYLGYLGTTLWSVSLDIQGSRGPQIRSGLTAGTWGFGGGYGEPGYPQYNDNYCGSFQVQQCYQHDLAVNFFLGPGYYWIGLQNGATPDPDAAKYYLAPTWHGGNTLQIDGPAYRLGGSVAPEPATLSLIATGFAGLAFARRRRGWQRG